MTRRQPERELQTAVVRYLRVACPDVFVTAIPNGGYRRKVEAALFKSMGVTAGVSDLMLLWRPAKVAFIELKAPGQRKYISDAQKAFLVRCTDLGIPTAVCDSLDDVWMKIAEWNVPCRDARKP